MSAGQGGSNSGGWVILQVIISRYCREQRAKDQPLVSKNGRHFLERVFECIFVESQQ